MNNKEMLRVVSSKAGVSLKVASLAVSGCVTAVHRALERREGLTIYGLGTFRSIRATPRVIRTLSGDDMVVGSRKISFLPSRTLRAKK